MLLLFFGFLAACLNVVVAVAPIVRTAHQPTSNGTKLLTFNITQSGELSAESRRFNWIKNGTQDGLHVKFAAGALILEDIVTEKQTTLISADKVPKSIREYWINTNLTKILYATNARKQYRYSYFADYFVQDVASGKIEPLVADQKQDIQYAVWSGNLKENIVGYVRGNNIYIWKDGKSIQVTKNGGPDMFNGVPDWVYEEEILESNFALWFNEAGDHLAYLSFNETGVPTYRVPYYMDRNNPKASVAPTYPRELEIRYPKVGATNPTVKLSLLKINWGQPGPKPQHIDVHNITYYTPEDCIVGEVAWLGARLAARTFSRVQDSSKLVLYDTRDSSSKVIKSQDGSDGWIDNNKAMQYLGVIAQYNPTDVWGKDGCCEEYFLDKTDLTNWDHYYLFPTMFSQNDPLPVTFGDYDARNIVHIDKAEHVIFFTSAERHATESHLYMVSYRTFEKVQITDSNKPGFYSASFSPGSKYFVLNYEGPNVPYQELYSTSDFKKPIRTITSNKVLQEKLKEYKLPIIRYADLKHPLGWNISVMLRYPANFNPDKKYPLLLTPYGGPGSQEVTKKMQGFDFKAYVSSDPELEYFTYTVDNRGTGNRGREFRTQVARHLGQMEAEDQVWAAAQLARQNRFIDRNKIAIWGWSYGGYLSAKVVESDSGVFSLGLITAPVSDWRLYDSMYTERFMGLLTTNSENYTTTSVRKVAGFKNIAGGVLLQHGTGDDNVHFQNSAALVDTLIGGGVGPDKLQVQYFPDSDHNIGWNGANRFVYKQLAKRLWEEKVRVVNGTVSSHQWTRAVAESGSAVFSEGFGQGRLNGLGKTWNATTAAERGVGMLVNGTREYEEKLSSFMKTLDQGEVETDTWTPFPGQV